MPAMGKVIISNKTPLTIMAFLTLNLFFGLLACWVAGLVAGWCTGGGGKGLI
jgi:hypothetical protein